MIVEHTESFQSWLSSILRPLCDADPSALAKYVLALIKKDKTEKELRQSMTDQLDVFLQNETKSFVTKLFDALKTKEYVNFKPSNSPPSSRKEPAGEGKSIGESPAKGEKPTASSTSETEPTSSTSGPIAIVNSTNSSQSSTLSSTLSSQPSCGQPIHEGKKGLNTLSVSPSVLLSSEGSSSANASQNDSVGSKEDSKSRRDIRRDVNDDRDKRRKRSRMDRDRRGSRSRSGDRNKRSRSPRLRDRNDRLRHRPRKSPLPRRYDRDVWDRRTTSTKISKSKFSTTPADCLYEIYLQDPNKRNDHITDVTML